MNCVNCEKEINGLPCCYCGSGMGKNIKTQETPSVTKPMNTWEDGQWLKGMGLSGSQADYILERMGYELQQQRREIVKEIRGMNKEYMWCDDGFDPDVPYGEHLSECERHYRMAVDDIIKKVGKHD